MAALVSGRPRWYVTGVSHTSLTGLNPPTTLARVGRMASPVVDTLLARLAGRQDEKV